MENNLRKQKLLRLYSDLIKLAYSVDTPVSDWIANNSNVDLEQLSNSIYNYIVTTYQEPERGELLRSYLSNDEVETTELCKEFKRDCAKQKRKLPWLQFTTNVKGY